MQVLKPDVCVIGANGAAMALCAAKTGAKVLWVSETGRPSTLGCMAARALQACARSCFKNPLETLLGVEKRAPPGLGLLCHDYVHTCLKQEEVLGDAGVEVLAACGVFVSERSFLVADKLIEPRFFVLATATTAQLPEMEGLGMVPYLTAESLLRLQSIPEHLIVLGAGPVGVEMAQAYLRLGAKVTLLQRSTLLGRQDPEAVVYVRAALKDEGVQLFEGVTLEDIQACDHNKLRLGFLHEGVPKTVIGTHVLVAIGNMPCIKSLNLDAAALNYDAQGLWVSPNFQSSNPRIYAIGDTLAQSEIPKEAQIQAVLRHQRWSFFCRPPTPCFVTYTDPEIAQVGLTEPFLKLDQPYRVHKTFFENNKRAQVDGIASGFLKLLTTPGGRLLGVTIVGPQAGELLLPWSLMLQQKLPLSALARCSVADLTLSAASSLVARGVKG